MSKFKDNAAPILKDDKTVSESQKSDLWSLFHVTKTPAELAQHLSELGHIHPQLRQDLIAAKSLPAIELNDKEKLSAVLKQMATMDPKVLDIVEKHPHVLSHYLAVNSGEKDNEQKAGK
jgi:hypothetical protein